MFEALERLITHHETLQTLINNIDEEESDLHDIINLKYEMTLYDAKFRRYVYSTWLYKVHKGMMYAKYIMFRCGKWSNLYIL